MSQACAMPSASRCARNASGSATKRCICGNVGLDSMTERAPGVMRSKRLTWTWPSMTGMPAWRQRTAMLRLRLVEERLDARARLGAAVQADELLDLGVEPLVVRPGARRREAALGR